MAAITFHINNIDVATNQTTEATLIDHVGGSGLGFYGGGFGISVPVGGYQDTTFVTNDDGTTQAVECKNIKYVSSDQGIAGAGTAEAISGIPNFQAPLNIRFTHDSAVSVQNCKLRIFDRTLISNHAEGVTTQVYELRHPHPVAGIDGTNKGTLSLRGSTDHTWEQYQKASDTDTPPDLSLTTSPGTSGLNTFSGDTLVAEAADGYLNHTSKEGTAHQSTRHDWYLALSASPDTIGSKTNYGLYFTLEYI
jgi:hypothetical protein